MVKTENRNGQKYQIFQNLLEMHKEHERLSVSQVWSETKLISFFHFDPLFCSIDNRIFIPKYRQVTPLSGGYHMQIIFMR